MTIVQNIVIFCCAGLTFGDIFFDSLLTVEYYHQYNNESFVESAKVHEVILYNVSIKRKIISKKLPFSLTFSQVLHFSRHYVPIRRINGVAQTTLSAGKRDAMARKPGICGAAAVHGATSQNVTHCTPLIVMVSYN